MIDTDRAELLDGSERLFGSQDKIIICCMAFILVGLISTIDKISGYDLNLSVLHLAPIAMMTWAAGRAWGMLLSAIAVAVWVTMFRGSHHYAGNFYHYWNGVMLLISFWTVVILIARLHEFVRNNGRRFADVLECIEGAAYVADPAQGKVLCGNRRFREGFAGLSFDKLDQVYRASTLAKAHDISWPDGRSVVMHVLPGS